METHEVVVLEYHNYDIIINKLKNTHLMIGVIWLAFVSAWLFAVCVDNSSTVHGQGGIRLLVEQGCSSSQPIRTVELCSFVYKV